jgi:hypothetical protein
MPHLLHEPPIHRHVGDPVLHVIPVSGLDAGDVAIATWRAAGAVTVEKTLAGGGLTVVTGAAAKIAYQTLDLSTVDDAEAVLIVDLDPADTEALGIGRWPWQARAGGAEAPVVDEGWLVLSKTIAAPSP